MALARDWWRRLLLVVVTVVVVFFVGDAQLSSWAWSLIPAVAVLGSLMLVGRGHEAQRGVHRGEQRRTTFPAEKRHRRLRQNTAVVPVPLFAGRDWFFFRFLALVPTAAANAGKDS